MTSPTHAGDPVDFAGETIQLPSLVLRTESGGELGRRPAAEADADAVSRVERALGRLESLQELLADELAPPIETPRYDVPAGFLLSVVIPIFNERATLRALLARVAAIPLPLQVVLVDDCSTDGTRELLAELAHADGVQVILHDINRGKGAALRTGFQAAKGQVIVVQDADLEYDPSDIPGLLEPILAGQADVVYGSRYLGETSRDRSRLHRWGNALLTWASNLFTGLQLTDMETCYKAFRRDALRRLELRQDRFGFEPEVTAKLARRGCRFAERPVGYQARGYAEGKKIGLRDALNALYCIIRYGLAD